MRGRELRFTCVETATRNALSLLPTSGRKSSTSAVTVTLRYGKYDPMGACSNRGNMSIHWRHSVGSKSSTWLQEFNTAAA